MGDAAYRLRQAVSTWLERLGAPGLDLMVNRAIPDELDARIDDVYEEGRRDALAEVGAGRKDRGLLCRVAGNIASGMWVTCADEQGVPTISHDVISRDAVDLAEHIVAEVDRRREGA